MSSAPTRMIDPAGQSHRDVYGLLISTVVPRPIALVSTADARGGRNLAPFSFFTAVSSAPPVLAVSTVSRRTGEKKDTLRNVEATGEFVVNVVSESMAEAMNASSADYPYGQDEFAHAGFSALPGVRVGAPRVAESPVQMECRLERILEIGRQPAYLILGEVLLFHVREDVVRNGRVDARALRPLARLGGSEYAALGEVFSMARPAPAPPSR